MKNKMHIMVLICVLLLICLSNITASQEIQQHVSYYENHDQAVSSTSNSSLISLSNLTDTNISVDIISRFDAIIDAFAYSDDYAYLCHEKNVLIVNVSNSSNPFLEGKYEANVFIRKIKVEGNFVYIFDGDKEISIINVSRPKMPFVESKYISRNHISAFAIKEKYLYTGEDRYLKVIDIGNKKEPLLIGNHKIVSKSNERIDGASGLPLPSIYQIEVENGFAYVNTRDGMFIMDVNDPCNIVRKGNYFLYNVDSINLKGDLAYFSCRGNGLYILNISNPKRPFIVSNYDIEKPRISLIVTPQNSDSMIITKTAIEGDFVYTIGDYYQLIILNATNPTNITKGRLFSTIKISDLGKVESSFEGFDEMPELLDVRSKGNVIYLADKNNGLIILSVKNKSEKNEVYTNVNENVVGLLNETEQKKEDIINHTKINDGEFQEQDSKGTSEKSNNVSKIPGFEFLDAITVIISLYCTRYLFDC